MTTSLPHRANVYCSLGHLIDGQFADTYLQEAGLVFCRGSIRLAGIHKPDIGTPVDFAYTRDNVTAARIPRRLRVISSFADPLQNVSTIEIGCKLSLLQDKRRPRIITTDVSSRFVPLGIKPENVDTDYATYRNTYGSIVAGSVFASLVADEILFELGITPAAPIPLTHRYMTDEFDLSQGYVSALGSLLQSEGYFGFLNDAEQLVVRDMVRNPTTEGPALTQDNIFRLGPVGVGALPAETVYITYSAFRLKPSVIDATEVPNPSPNEAETPDGEGAQRNTAARRAGWAKSSTTGFEVAYSIPFEGGTYTGSYRPTVESFTSFNENGAATRTVTTSTKPYAAAAGGYASEVLSAGGTVSLDNVINRAVNTSSYDSLGRVVRTVDTDSVSFAEFAGSLQLRWAFGPGNIVSISGQGIVKTQEIVTSFQYAGDSVRRAVDRYQNWALTQAGQQAIAAGNASFTSSEQVSDFFNTVVNSGLVYTGSEISVSSRSSLAEPDNLPSLTDLTISADTTDGAKNDKVAELEYEYGAAESDSEVVFEPPFSPDSFYNFSGSLAVPFDATVQAQQSAIAYGRLQNRLRLAQKEGLSMQIPPEYLPPSPFDCMYVTINGITGQFRANGTSWTFNSQGIVAQTDALFWAGIGQTASPGPIWFPMPPGVSTLPLAPSVTTNPSPAPASSGAVPSGWDPDAPDLDELFTELPVATAPVFPQVIDTPSGLAPYVETVNVDAVGRAVFEVESFPYSLAPQTTDVDMVGRAVFEVQEVALTVAPAASFTLTARVPQIYSPAWVPVPTMALTLTSFAPTITGAAVINMPAVALTLTARRPDVRAATIVAMPTGALTLTSYVPTITGNAAPDVDFANVSLLLPFDGSNGSTTFTDESNSAYTVTAFGNAQISTAQSKWGGSSLLLDGSGDYATITSPPANLREWWTDTFQIDAWVRVTNFTVRSAAGSSVLVGHMEPTTGTQYWSFGPVNSGTIRFYYFNGAVENVSSSSTITLNTWHHIRFTHDSGTLRVFVNGNLDGSASIVGTPLTPSGEPFTIGMCENVPFDGYVDDLRIVRGGVVSTASFTPPAGPFPTS